MNAKITALEVTLEDLFSGADSETKSSAGDKHETGRAMLQIEQARIGKQLSDLRMQRNVLRSIHLAPDAAQVALGSLIETDRGWFYMSVALGKVKVNDTTVMTVSPNAPLGAQWLGVRAGDTMTFNGISYTILGVH